MMLFIKLNSVYARLYLKVDYRRDELSKCSFTINLYKHIMSSISGSKLDS